MIILGTNSIKDTGYNVANSLRFNKGSSDNLTRTPSSQSNLQKSTFSFWLKRSTLGEQIIFSTGSPDTAGSLFQIYFSGNDSLHIETDSPSLVTNKKFRDVSAWYHILVAVDTTQGTASNRIKIYVNGVQETSFSLEQYPSQNANLHFNKTNVHYIGVLDPTYGTYFDGYMAEVVEIDGTQNAVTDFGEFDSDSNIWKPIDVSGLTFGTNGFYLEFKESGTGTNANGMGADTSGNTNHFAVNNLTAIDQSTDTCTNNFATGNPLAISSGGTNNFSDGNLTIRGSNSHNTRYGSTFAMTSGKYYFETKIKGSVTFGGGSIGIVDYDNFNINGSTGGATPSGHVAVIDFNTNDGDSGLRFNNNDQRNNYAVTLNVNDIIGHYVDMDNGFYYLAHNGTLVNSGDPTSGANGTGNVNRTGNLSYDFSGKTMTIGGSIQSTDYFEVNFGSPSFAISSGNTDGNGYGNFEYAVPSGYYSLNTKNLAEYG